MADSFPDPFPKQHRFLVGIDSDGCAFDTMELKHKECFIPNTIRYFGLQPVSRYAREAAEFVNLYSQWRGANRFPALIVTMDLLAERPEVAARGFRVPRLESLRGWIERESRLGNPALEEEVARTGNEELAQVLAWSKAVNASVAEMVHGVPPFPYVRESLQKLAEVADMIVCSATPNEALRKEWEEHQIAGYVAAICGQEVGKKDESLGRAMQAGYDADHVLMIGDAPGDLKAARKVGAHFYPIRPGYEAESWQRFVEEACDRFLESDYAGSYEEQLTAEFLRELPETPPWKR